MKILLIILGCKWNRIISRESLKRVARGFVKALEQYSRWQNVAFIDVNYYKIILKISEGMRESQSLFLLSIKRV